MDVTSHLSAHREPLHTFNKHSLSVTDVHVGAGGVCARVFTASLDKTCKVRAHTLNKMVTQINTGPVLRFQVFELGSGQLIHSFLFESAVTSVTTDICESELYAGASDGSIFTVNLFEQVDNLTCLPHLRAL